MTGPTYEVKEYGTIMEWKCVPKIPRWRFLARRRQRRDAAAQMARYTDLFWAGWDFRDDAMRWAQGEERRLRREAYRRAMMGGRL